MTRRGEYSICSVDLVVAMTVVVVLVVMEFKDRVDVSRLFFHGWSKFDFWLQYHLFAQAAVEIRSVVSWFLCRLP